MHKPFAILHNFFNLRSMSLLWGVLAPFILHPAACSQSFFELGRTTYQGNDYLLIALEATMPGGVATPMDPFEARLAAEEYGGWLMTVASREEEVAVVEALRGFRTTGGWDGDFWMGFTDRIEEGTFFWENGDPVTYTNWAPGEPNNAGAGEDWGEIWILDDENDPEYITWNDESDSHDENFAVVEIISIPPPLVLQVDPQSGYARFRSTISAAEISSVTLNAYELLPEGTPFDVPAWSASNLSARDVDAIDPNAEGERWETLNASPDQLLEAYFLGGSEFVEGETMVMGKVFPNDSGEAPLTFNYTVNVDFTDPERPDSQNVTYEDALVEYVSFSVGPGPGDYNGDGSVDAADYTTWRDSFGKTEPGLAADGNGDNVVDQLDYDVWVSNFGTSSGSSLLKAAAVPEPTTIWLSILGMVWAASVRCRH